MALNPSKSDALESDLLELEQAEKQLKLDLALREAIKKNDFDSVFKYLNQGADVNHTPYYDRNFQNIGQNNRSPLKLALKEAASIEIIKLLISKGAELNPDDDTWPPLQVAAEFSTPEIVQYLIDHKANVNQNDSGFGIPLFRTLRKNRLELAAVLIKNGCNLNLTVQSGYISILEMACIDNLHDFIKLFIHNGADISFRCLENVIKNEEVQLLRELLEFSKSSVNIKGYKSNTILHFVIENKLKKKNELIQCILDFQPNLNLTDHEGYTALQRFEKTLDKSILDAFHKKIQEFPINSKNDPDEKLFTETEKLLLKMQSSPTLSWLCIHTLVGELINGNENNKLEQLGQIIFLYEKEHALSLVQESISEHLRISSPVNTLLPRLLEVYNREEAQQEKYQKQLNAAQILIFMKADVNIITRGWEQSALRSACENNLIQMVSLLIQHQADPNIGDRTGVTPINFCFDHSVSIDILKLLLSTKINYKLLCCSKYDHFPQTIVTLIDKISLEKPMIKYFVKNKIFKNFEITEAIMKILESADHDEDKVLKEKCFLILNKIQAEINELYISLLHIPTSHILKHSVFKDSLRERTEGWATTKNGQCLLNAMIEKAHSSPVIWSTIGKRRLNGSINVNHTISDISPSQNVQTNGSQLLNQFQNEINAMSQELKAFSNDTSSTLLPGSI